MITDSRARLQITTPAIPNACQSGSHTWSSSIAAHTTHTAPQIITAIVIRVANALVNRDSSAAPMLVCNMWPSD